MTSLYLYLFSFLFICIDSQKVHTDQSRFDNYRIYRIQLDTEEHITILQKIEKRSDSYQFYGHPRNIGQKLNVLVAAHKIAEITDILTTYNMNYDILSYNFQEKIDQQSLHIMPKDSSPEKFDWGHFFHLETINAWMEDMAANFDEISVVNMGKSLEGRDIKGLQIGTNPNNTAVFIESGIHAREWIAPATATYIINELITSKNSTVRKIAEGFNWFIFPVFNVDGYSYTFNSDRMWRKNRQLFGICRGVDLNRNYPYHWNDTGSSSDPCRYDFAGPSTASEPETQALMNFINEHAEKHHIKTYIALHSYSQLIMFPYGTQEKVSNFDDLDSIGRKAAKTIEETSGKKYTSGSIYNTIYPSSGCSQDWARKKLDIPIAFTFELRGDPSSPDLFILPADEIQPTAEEIFAAIITILTEADKLGYYKN